MPDDYRRALSYSFRLLTYRPRSVAELRERLTEREYTPATIDRVLERLKDLGLADDTAFAQYWKERGARLQPRSQRLIVAELRQKGIDANTAAAAVADVDDEEVAYQAARSRLPVLERGTRGDIRTRLTGFLQRRGFTYAIIRTTLRRLDADGALTPPAAPAD